MPDVRWSTKSQLLASGAAAGDNFPITDADADTDKYMTLAEVKKYVLENGAIGGTTAGDIADIDSAQTFTNKRLTTPGINSATPITADSAEINKLDGLTATTANLQLTATYAAKIPYLANVTADIQAQINALNILPTALTYCYGLTFIADGSGSKVLTESAILTALGISPTAYIIDHTSLHGTICTVTGGTYTVIDDTGVAAPNVAIQWTTQTDSGQTHLDEIKCSGVVESSEYNIAFSFKIVEKAGV